MHIALALYYYPNDEGALGLLNQMIGSVRNPADLLAGLQPETRADAQVLAYILARCARYDEAVDILLQVVMSEPRTGILQWLIDWLDEPEAAGKIPIVPFDDFFRWIAGSAQNLSENDEARAETVDRLPALVERMRSTQTNHGDFLSSAAIALRRTGHVEEALATAKAAYEVSPKYFSAIAVANCLRTSGDIDGAIEMFKASLTFDPNDLAARLDIGDTYFNHWRAAEAIGWYEEVLQREPGHPWAEPSLYAAQYWATADAGWKLKLDDFARRYPTNEHAQSLNDNLIPYFSKYLREPVDVTVNMLRDRKSQDSYSPGDSLMLNIGLVEAPSPLWVVRRVIESHGMALNVRISKVQTPDPRVPFGEVEHVLWRYNDDNTATPAIRQPTENVAAIVANIASTDYDYEAWCRLAQTAATSIEVDKLTDLLGVMIFPGECPASISPWMWLVRNQIAAALIIASLPGPWVGSTRRSMLQSLVNGPLDWTVGAGAIGLACAAKADPDAAAEARELLTALMDRLPDEGHITYLPGALAALLELPNLTPAERKDYIDMLSTELGED